MGLERGQVTYFWMLEDPSHISGMAEAKDFIFCVGLHVEG